MARIEARLEAWLGRQTGALFPWAVVAFASGIGFYFALRVEPPIPVLVAAACLGALGLVTASRVPPVLAVLALAMSLPLFGLSVAGARAHLVAGPLIEGRYYGPVEGRVVGIDRSASDKMRLTLDRVALPWMPREAVPRRVRISLHGDQRWIDPKPGSLVILTGHLSAPNGPVEPGGFDFRRHAWFLGIGGVGYTRSPALALAPAEPGSFRIARLRHAISNRVRAAMPETSGAVAAALLSGDRSAIEAGTTEALRASNLAHLLAISGLHMGLVTGIVFAALRLALVLLPGLGLVWPVKKIAAGGALLAGAGYLALSGGNVATERAFVMVAVMLLAVLADRRALSLRSVALAGLVVLLLRPEALLSPGFQMSFAATTALVAAFALWRDTGMERRLPPLLRGAAAVVISSAVAGAATAPFAMAHFNQVAHYGLLANLLAVPLMGALVMPAGLIALALMPFGLEALPLWVMRLGLDWILGVADWAAALPGAVGKVVAPSGAVLPLVALAGLIAVLVAGRGRLVALGPAALAGLMWWQTERPWLLIDANGALVGEMTAVGRALSRERGAGFAAGLWLENDGDPADQVQAAARWLQETAVIHIADKKGEAAFGGCSDQEIVVSRYTLPPDLPCLAFGPEELAATGAVAVARRGQGFLIRTVADQTGRRIWADRIEPHGPSGHAARQ
ncbi:competence protein ComEC [Roseivivax halotolerans]|uniref:Competence protein ComEC n=1 Tax=Roseivivax halotolerans TaxID=93684 RepID=A0A1I5XCT2_9RHOB|nr:ComEC/Rec2 family competence protein [Roseivivax halotolerans]SFQ29792.1 competence protein ComEC [Roseivivax halotolerans]